MVVKLVNTCANAPLAFEYGVILNGSQTDSLLSRNYPSFEYGVILNGSQTLWLIFMFVDEFEYGVILNGSQTSFRPLCLTA